MPVRDLESERAADYLKDTYANAQKFKLPPLGQRERKLLHDKMERGELRDIGRFTDTVVRTHCDREVK